MITMPRRNTPEYEAKRRQRRRAVLKATYDPVLAEKLKNRSDKYIFENYGISVDHERPVRSVPDLRRVPKKQKLRKRTEKAQRIEKFKYGVEEGLDPRHSKWLMHKPWHKVKSHVTDFVVSKIHTPKERRKIEWSIWGSNKDYPDFIKKIARDNNKWYQENYDGVVDVDDTRYGWAVAHYVYVDGLSVEEVRAFLQPSRFDGDFYEDEREEFLFGEAFGG